MCAALHDPPNLNRLHMHVNLKIKTSNGWLATQPRMFFSTLEVSGSISRRTTFTERFSELRVVTKEVEDK